MEGRVMVCEGTGLSKDQREFVEHYVVLSKSTLSLHDKKPGMFHRGSANSLFSISLSSTSFSEITSSSSSSSTVNAGGVGVEFLSGSNEINVNLPDGRLFVFTWNSTRKYEDWVDAIKKVFRRSAEAVVVKDGGGKRDNKKEKKEKQEKRKKEKSEKRGSKSKKDVALPTEISPSSRLRSDSRPAIKDSDDDDDDEDEKDEDNPFEIEGAADLTPTPRSSTSSSTTSHTNHVNTNTSSTQQPFHPHPPSDSNHARPRALSNDRPPPSSSSSTSSNTPAHTSSASHTSSTPAPTPTSAPTPTPAPAPAPAPEVVSEPDQALIREIARLQKQLFLKTEECENLTLMLSLEKEHLIDTTRKLSCLEHFLRNTLYKGFCNSGKNDKLQAMLNKRLDRQLQSMKLKSKSLEITRMEVVRVELPADFLDSPQLLLHNYNLDDMDEAKFLLEWSPHECHCELEVEGRKYVAGIGVKFKVIIDLLSELKFRGLLRVRKTEGNKFATCFDSFPDLSFAMPTKLQVGDVFDVSGFAVVQEKVKEIVNKLLSKYLFPNWKEFNF
eukprot:TRINITY_DN5958_c0_g1_i3.p1 TRINITY_DN5958_c0_g1~~TRINITY_DN5958_c0_g1_i3.p1  ORF type:complete len:553 (-),score=141.57 TRINITY_DN5958_c0_g1_i3:8-1666(-)